MYEKNGRVYAAPYKLLKSKSRGSIAYQKEGTPEQFTEIDAPVDDMHLSGRYAIWGSGNCIQAIKSGKEYGWYKERLIKRRYSNDQQIAIMLNKDADADGELQYRRMQAWRDWAADVAHRLASLPAPAL